MQRPGTVVPAEVTSQWPLPNRMAMERSGFVTYFQSPAEARAAKEDEAEVAASVQAHPIRARVSREDLLARLETARRAKATKRQLAGSVTEDET